ncbi:hypothetical protein C2E23DRAFT_849393 [Lenzites betulinus]|nr:hypothetical protein C2E23DRAFT_849393 [Lenzites betulinus]
MRKGLARPVSTSTATGGPWAYVRTNGVAIGPTDRVPPSRGIYTLSSRILLQASHTRLSCVRTQVDPNRCPRDQMSTPPVRLVSYLTFRDSNSNVPLNTYASHTPYTAQPVLPITIHVPQAPLNLDHAKQPQPGNQRHRPHPHARSADAPAPRPPTLHCASSRPSTDALPKPAFPYTTSPRPSSPPRLRRSPYPDSGSGQTCPSSCVRGTGGARPPACQCVSRVS